jgi:hypothetical protein
MASVNIASNLMNNAATIYVLFAPSIAEFNRSGNL